VCKNKREKYFENARIIIITVSFAFVFLRSETQQFFSPCRAPESAPLKSKMIYASSKDAIKKKFTGTSIDYFGQRNYSFLITISNGCFFFLGIKHEWQVNGLDDIKDRSTLGEKLGGNVVVSLEGKPL
jgi:hypothetical protein